MEEQQGQNQGVQTSFYNSCFLHKLLTLSYNILFSNVFALFSLQADTFSHSEAL